VLTFEQIKELVELVCERDLNVLELERSGFHLRIEGQGSPAVAAPPASPQGVVSANSASGELAGREAAASPAAPEVDDGIHIVNSPIVGTFYAAPSPDADPYVKVGDSISPGQVLCIVEAMKLMNEIESEMGGVIEEIYPKNAQPVEFGEPLFGIRIS